MGAAWASAVRDGVDWLRSAQLTDGEVPSYSSPLLGAPSWEPDRPNFVTALTVLALDGVHVDGVAGMLDRARAYLMAQRESGGRWRYWSTASPLHDYTPHDADDTACCALAIVIVAGSIDVTTP